MHYSYSSVISVGCIISVSKRRKWFLNLKLPIGFQETFFVERKYNFFLFSLQESHSCIKLSSLKKLDLLQLLKIKKKYFGHIKFQVELFPVNFTKFTGKHMCECIVFNNFNKRETQSQMFSCEFCEVSKNTFFYRTPTWLFLHKQNKNMNTF